MDLPLKEKTFEFDHVGEDTGKEYKGKFTVLATLTVGQKHALALEKTRLLGNYANPTDDLAGLAIILANLRAKIIDAPEWWKQSAGGANVEDESALVVLYRQVQEAELEWKEELKKKANTPAPSTGKKSKSEPTP